MLHGRQYRGGGGRGKDRASEMEACVGLKWEQRKGLGKLMK